MLTATDSHDNLLLSLKAGQTNGTEYVWSPYGGGTVTDRLPGFNGERCDPVSGNYHLGNGYRAYSPRLMRFTCPDSLSPFGAGGINSYAYCAGDPVNFTDPSGHISGAGWAGIALGVLGLAVTAVSSMFWAPVVGPVVLVMGTLGILSDVTSIASGLLEEVNPQTSGLLGNISLGTGLAGAAAGIGTGIAQWAGRGMARTAVRSSPSLALEMQPLRRGSVAQSTHSVDAVSTGLGRLPPEMIREIGRNLPFEDLKALRLTSRQTADAISVRDIIRRTSSVQRYSTALPRFQMETLLHFQDFEPYAGRIMRMRDYMLLHDVTGLDDAIQLEVNNIRNGYSRNIFDPDMTADNLFLDMSSHTADLIMNEGVYVDLNDILLG